MELGYLNEVADLNPENGEVAEFTCREESWLSLALQGYDYLSTKVKGLME